MGMNVKAIERKIAYLGKEGGKDQYRSEERRVGKECKA